MLVGGASLVARGALPMLSYVTVAHANTANITIPAAAMPGDFAVLVDTPIGAGAPTLVIPSGFTSVYDFSGSATSNLRASFSGKILVAADPGASITGMTGASASRKSVLIFRPTTQPFSVFSGGGGTGAFTDGDPAEQTITLTGLAVPIIAVGVNLSTGTSDLSSSQMTVLATDSGSRSLVYSILRSNATNQLFNASDLGVNNLLAGCYFILR
jgi:hypothetical protein